jgi:hypothetical protein
MGEPMGNLGHTHTHTHPCTHTHGVGMGFVMGLEIDTHTHTHGGYTHCNPRAKTYRLQLEHALYHY